MQAKKVLILSIHSFNSLSEGGIFVDLIKEFKDNGHDISVAMPAEGASETKVTEVDGVKLIKISCGAVQKVGAIKKVLNLRSLDTAAKKILKKDFADKFDLVVAMISHCAFIKTVEFVKNRDGAFVYNMVKDIFPQNAVDMGMMTKSGLKGFIYKYFKSKESKYYALSDMLGAISPAAADFLAKDNISLDSKKIEVNPNSVVPSSKVLTSDAIATIRAKHNIPLDKTVFVYGGNLGVPQGIDFLLDIVAQNESIDNDAYFVIAGSGTEYGKIANYFNTTNPNKAKLIKKLSVSDFDDLCLASDVGLVFLNKAFTIANYPSRALSYMQARLPIIFAVDAACDAGLIATQNDYGFNCINGELDNFFKFVEFMLANSDRRKKMGQNAYDYMCNNYTVRHSYDIISKHLAN